MKVTIDTKEDSHEDIKKVLEILTQILEKKEINSTDLNDKITSVDTTNMMNLFDSEPKKEIPNTPPDFQGLMKLTREAQTTKKNNPDPRIEFF